MPTLVAIKHEPDDDTGYCNKTEHSEVSAFCRKKTLIIHRIRHVAPKQPGINLSDCAVSGALQRHCHRRIYRNYVCPYPLSPRVPLYAPQPGVILWNHDQDDDLACGHSVSMVLSPGAVYQQTFELLPIRIVWAGY